MFEQENSLASAFPDQTLPNARLQSALLNPWFVKDSYDLLNEEPDCKTNLKAKSSEKSSNGLQAVLPEEVLVDSSKIYQQYFSESSVNDIENWEQPMTEVLSEKPELYFEANSPLSFWGNCPLDLETMKMDEVFQVDKDDLVQSPTLAELNANDESLFDSFDVFFWTEVSDNTSDLKDATLNDSKQNTSKTSPLKKYSESQKAEPFCKKQCLIANHQELNDLSEVKTKEESNIQTVPTSVGGAENLRKSLRSSVNKCLTTEQIFKNMPNAQLAGDESAENISKLSHQKSNDDLTDSEDDSDIDAEYSSDAGEDSEDEGSAFKSKHASTNQTNVQSKRSRYFWQYNIQSKGPKTKLAGKSSNLCNISGVGDPVFSANCPIKGVKHSGKARKGDGNDLTPNPKKLFNIGTELEKLNSLIDDLVPVNELPVNARTKSRKEKNKLASRACRLKKKAQHEANKLKLFGLQEEQKCLLAILSEMKKLIKDKVLNFKQRKDLSLMIPFEILTKEKPVTKVAGCSANFVNDVLQDIASGDESGGLSLNLLQET